MPFEHRNEKELLAEGGFHLIQFEKVQVSYGAETHFGTFYAVHDGEQMVQSADLGRAKEMMSEFVNGQRKFGDD